MKNEIKTKLEITQGIMRDYFSDIKYRAQSDMIQSPEMVLASKVGQCWEQAELARFLLGKNGVPSKTYFIDINHGPDNKPWPNYQTHTFLAFQDNRMHYWFEHSWEPYVGIHGYNSLKELLSDVKNKHIKSYETDGQIKAQNFRIREYDSIKLPVAGNEFLWHCINSKVIEIENLSR